MNNKTASHSHASSAQYSINTNAPIRVAVVGAGFIADFHLDILSQIDAVELVAICDTDRGRAQKAADKYRVKSVVTDIADLPSLDVQIVHLTVPPDLHVEITWRLLELGIGVLVEKPLALSSADARMLSDLARQRGLPLAVNHNNVFQPAFARLLKQVQAGAVGRVEHVQVTLSVPLRQLDAGDFTHWMFRAPRNIIFEQATHPVSQIESLLGQAINVETTILSSRNLQPAQVFNDRWLVAATAERGTAEMYLAFGQSFTRSTLQVLGTDGSLEVDLLHNHIAGEQMTLWLDFWNSFLAGIGRAAGYFRSAWRVLLGWIGSTLGVAERRDAFYVGMRDSIRNFYSALIRGERLPGDGPRAIAVAQWCEAIARAVPSEAPPATAEIPEPAEARPGEVVVLGATGFIGRRVVGKLLAQGVPVTAVGRRRHSLPPEVLEPALDGRLRYFQAGLHERDKLEKAFVGAAACIHLATGGGDDWATVQNTMVNGSRLIGEICLAQKVKRLVYVSSIAALYGGADAGVSEIADDYPADPQPSRRPVYARGKIAAEEALLALHWDKGLSVVIARPGVVMGKGTPMQHSGLGLWVRDNHCVGWGHGKHVLPLVWVDDVADGLVSAALYSGNELDGKAVNLCSRVPLSAVEVVNEFRRHTGRRIEFHPRALWFSQIMEIGKWVVKKIGRRPGVVFPSWRDLKSRSLAVPFTCENARNILRWSPLEDREDFLQTAVRVYRKPGAKE